MNSEALICEICGQEARGSHYGAVACRACAAFFRRTGTSKHIKPCSRKKQCKFFKNGFFTCKFCRLQKCFTVGMSSETFQFDRDAYKVREMVQLDRRIPMQYRGAILNRNQCDLSKCFQYEISTKNDSGTYSNFQTMDIFLGRSNFIIFCAPQSPESSEKFKKNFIDVQFLLDEALTVLHQGSETPLIARNSLGKMAFGFRKIQNEDQIFENLHKIPEFGKTQTLAQWEYYILKMTKWLTYFDDFQKLEQSLQKNPKKNLVHVFQNFQKFSKKNPLLEFPIHLKNLFNFVMSISMKISNLQSVNFGKIFSFMEINTEIRLDSLTREMIQLEPSDIELSFMLSQLCFHYVGKRFQGEILRISEKFQEILADDLHDYYVNEMKKSNYGRMAQMMRINNQIQKDIIRNREKTDLAILFDVFDLEFSHPEIITVKPLIERHPDRPL
ncbi:Protein CBG22875 [Caenorhabditis briggsae]|uniref:Protein CBG22875 n=1 Tax=Caenorhabditis briggsae TaxID=6238 RepID=A8Y397_CAEBR|nr:Protein CBG22875 [Caenorhabditis briggsae]CAP39366.1 Protein CBG22875 [Caenorhabditis briggsae]